MPPHVIAPELQERGALHHHIATPVTHRIAGYLLWEQLVRLAPAYGFGH